MTEKRTEYVRGLFLVLNADFNLGNFPKKEFWGYVAWRGGVGEGHSVSDFSFQTAASVDT